MFDECIGLLASIKSGLARADQRKRLVGTAPRTENLIQFELVATVCGFANAVSNGIRQGSLIGTASVGSKYSPNRGTNLLSKVLNAGKRSLDCPGRISR
jgi:hypothetical protein